MKSLVPESEDCSLVLKENNGKLPLELCFQGWLIFLMFNCIIDFNIQIENFLPATIPVELNISVNKSQLEEMEIKGLH